jgi:hypothetical protein
MEPSVICKLPIYMAYNENYYNLIPLKASDQLFLAINEDDFTFDGFCIARFGDVKKMHIKRDKYDEIIQSEGLLDNLCVPEINLENGGTVFDSLKGIGKNIVVSQHCERGV